MPLLRGPRPGAVLRGAGPRHDASRRRARRRSRPGSRRRCARTTTRSAPTAATTTRSPAGVPMAPIFAELFGRGTGLLGGKGGSMHLTSVGITAMGSYAIVGAHLPIALGAAWSAQYRGSGQVAVCFFGDGTTNIGAFHEALNMAAVWKAPVVFVCENNQYMEYTPIGDVTAVERPPRTGRSAYGLESIVVDGNDVDAVHAEVAPRPSSGPAPGTDRRSSRRSRTATAGTRGPTPASTGPTTRSPPGRRATRSQLPGAPARGCGVEAATLDAIDDETREAVAAAEARHGPRRSPTPTCSRPRSGATEARRGGTDVSRGHRRGHRPGDAARPDGRPDRRGRRRGRRRVQADRRPVRPSSARRASATRRSASRRSSGRRWAPR